MLLYHAGGENQRFSCLWSILWSKPFFGPYSWLGKIPQTPVPQGFPGFCFSGRGWCWEHSQSRRATNCAIPGYLVVLMFCGKVLRVRPALSAHRRVSQFPGTVRARQSGHFLEIASLIPPPAALRRFPQSLARFLLRCPKKTSRLRFARFFRPRPLARLPVSATGGGRLAPQLRYTRLFFCILILWKRRQAGFGMFYTISSFPGLCKTAVKGRAQWPSLTLLQ